SLSLCRVESQLQVYNDHSQTKQARDCEIDYSKGSKRYEDERRGDQEERVEGNILRSLLVPDNDRKHWNPSLRIILGSSKSEAPKVAGSPDKNQKCHKPWCDCTNVSGGRCPAGQGRAASR